MKSIPVKFIVPALFIVFSTVFFFSIEDRDPLYDLFDLSSLNKAGIVDLSVSYQDSKLHLTLDLAKPKTCEELLELLRIHSINIKDYSYDPTCQKISDTRTRITYHRRITQ